MNRKRSPDIYRFVLHPGSLPSIACLICVTTLTVGARGGELDFAHGLYRQKRFELAADEYASYLNSHPDGPAVNEAKFFLAESYVQAKKEAEALPLFEMLIEQASKMPGTIPEPQWTQSLFRAGQISFNRKQFDNADKYFQAFLDRFPDHPLRGQAIYLLAEARLERNDPAAAEQALSLAAHAKIEPSLADYILLTKGKLADQQNKAEEAAKLYRQVIEHLGSSTTDPRIGEAYYRLGTLRYKQKNYAEAVKILSEARGKLSGQSVIVPITLQEGICLLLLNDPKNAKARFDEILSQYPKHPLASQAIYQLARVALQTGDVELAQSSVRRLLETESESPLLDSAQLVLGETLLNAKELDAKIRTDQLQQLVGKSRNESTKQQLAYYAGLATYETGDIAAAGPLLELAGKSSSPNLQSDASYVLGLVRMKEQRPADAIPLLLAFGKDREPSNSTRSALLNAAKAIALLPDSPEMQQARKELFAAAKRDPNGAKVLLDVGNQFFGQKKYAESREAFEAAVEKEKDGATHVPALLGLGWSQYYLGDRSAATTLFAQAKDSPNGNPTEKAEAIYMLGIIASEEGKNEDGAKLLEQVYREYSDSSFAVEAGLRAAGLLAQTNHADEADKLYESLSQREDAKEKRVRATYDRAWLALDRNDLSTGADLLQRVVDDPMAGSLAPEAAIKLAELLQSEGKIEPALAMINKAESLKPSASLQPALLYRRGLLNRDLSKPDQARKDFESLLASAPDSPFASAALFWLGETDFESNRNDGAITTYQRLIERKDAGKYAALSHLRLAQTYLKMQKWDEADKEADKLADESVELPVREEGLYVKGRVRQQKAEFDAAREFYRKIIGEQRTETAAKAQFMLGETFLLQERFDEAIKEFLKVEILYSIPEWQSFALLEVGKCYTRQSDIENARKAFADVVEKYSQMPAAAEAKKQLETLAKTSASSSP
ncbi:tetratricopeptide repeat protein [bacterium]|nr:tetratricopeptide repeat protein [bacterium]